MLSNFVTCVVASQGEVCLFVLHMYLVPSKPHRSGNSCIKEVVYLFGTKRPAQIVDRRIKRQVYNKLHKCINLEGHSFKTYPLSRSISIIIN